MQGNELGIHKFSYNGKDFFYSADNHRIYSNAEAVVQELPVSNQYARKVRINTIWLNLTSDCNLACRYCFNPPANVKNHKKSHKMSKETARQTIMKLASLWKLHQNQQPARIIFFGGEPLLNFDVMEHSIHFAREWSKISGVPFTFSISTNGTAITDKAAEIMARENFVVQLSIDGPKEIHDRHRIFRSGKGSYDTIIKNMEYFLDKPELKWHARVTIAEGTYPISTSLRYFEDSKFKTVHFKFVNDNNECGVGMGDSDFAVLEKDIDNTVKEVLNAKRNGLKVIPFEEHFDSLRTGKYKRFTCAAGSGSLSIDPEGYIYPCHRFHENKDYKIGHISEDFDSTISEKFATLKTEDIPGCQSCWAVKFCSGCCPAESLAFNKPLGYPHEDWCRMKKLEAEISLKLAVAVGLVDNSILRSYL